jgi:hypothetical protein
MEGCEPCSATRPEWTKIKNVLSPTILNRNDIVIAAIDYQLAEKLKNLKLKPTSFPTMKFITNGGVVSENYEDSSITKKDRLIDSFIEWIHLKTNIKETETEKRNLYSKKYNKMIKHTYKGGKRNKNKSCKRNKNKSCKRNKNKSCKRNKNKSCKRNKNKSCKRNL